MRRRVKQKKSKLRRVLATFIKMVFICICAVVLFVTITNVYVILSVKDRIFTEEEAAALAAKNGKPQCAVVLGAAVYRYTPSPILRDRLDAGLGLYKDGATDVLLFSGDDGQVEYNEVEAMRRYALSKSNIYDLEKKDIYLDHAGFSTYESMYRLKKVYHAKSAFVVTQKYHLYRALYSAEKLGIDAYGVVAEPREKGQLKRDIREIFARTKDFCYVLFDVQPKFLGDAIELKSGGGG